MASCCLHTRSARALRHAVVRALGLGALLALLAATTMVGSAHAATASVPSLSGISFNGDFQRGITPWTSTGGGAQCANYGTPSTGQRMRGSVYADPSTAVGGVQAARFDLPASSAGFPMQACELLHGRPLGLGTDDYYGYSFYVPAGWTDGTVSPGGFWGIETAQIHFENIWGAPIAFQLHSDHMTLALETGPCSSYGSATPGCQWRSNADNPNGDPGNLGARYVVPPGMQKGVWHEIVMHVHWASDNTGQIQVWHRIKGDPSWTQTVNLSGFPTVQWDATQGCCVAAATDKIGAYRGQSNAPTSVWLGNFLIGSSFNAVAAVVGQSPALPSTGSTHAQTRPAHTQTKPKMPRHQAIARAAAKRRHARACRIQRDARRAAGRHGARRHQLRGAHRHHHRHAHHRSTLRCGGNFR